MLRRNADLRIEVVRNGLTYKDIAKHMGISHFWLSRAMSQKMTDKMHNRIMTAIAELSVCERGRRA